MAHTINAIFVQNVAFFRSRPGSPMIRIAPEINNTTRPGS
jgi:hypothetical protein